MPDPIDAQPDSGSRRSRSMDIISLLVNIYGSKELFVNEYCQLLADRLLSQFTFNTEKEIRYLELLKLRFGESLLHYCEVMLKDVADTKRINAHIHTDDTDNNHKEFQVDAMIISDQFWPQLKDENLKIPESIKQHLDVYTKAYEALKGNRTLLWKPHLGQVDVTIELQDRTLDLTVTPLQATIIHHFQDKNEWSIDDLSQEMQITPSLLRRRAGYWVSQGVLLDNGDLLTLLEQDNSSTVNRSAREGGDYLEEKDSFMASTSTHKDDELQMFWSYIVGMLTNLEALPLERIFMMLKMFAMQGPSINECTQQDLKNFLEKKVRNQELYLSAGLYRLPKN